MIRLSMSTPDKMFNEDDAQISLADVYERVLKKINKRKRQEARAVSLASVQSS